MSDKPTSQRLGRGLAQLIGDTAIEEAVQSGDAHSIPIAFISPNPKNPRLEIEESDLKDLSDSIRTKGVMQPIIVRQMGQDDYELIAGERRWRAAQMAGLHDIPIILRNVSDREAMEIAIIENVQRTNLNIIEEALGYQSLIDEFGYTQNEMAEVIGKSRPYVANTLRLLKLPESVLGHVRNGDLSAGHARALITVDNPEDLSRKIIDKDLSVRDIEKLVAEQRDEMAVDQTSSTNSARPKQEKDADTLALEHDLEQILGLGVSIHHKGSTGGRLVINYATIEQLDDVCQRLRSHSYDMH